MPPARSTCVCPRWPDWPRPPEYVSINGAVWRVGWGGRNGMSEAERAERARTGRLGGRDYLYWFKAERRDRADRQLGPERTFYVYPNGEVRRGDSHRTQTPVRFAPIGPVHPVTGTATPPDLMGRWEAARRRGRG